MLGRTQNATHGAQARHHVSHLRLRNMLPLSFHSMHSGTSDFCSHNSQGAWRPALNLSTVLSNIQLLLAEPNPDDGLMADIVRQTDMHLAGCCFGHTLCLLRFTACHAFIRVAKCLCSPCILLFEALQTAQFKNDRAAFDRQAAASTRRHAQPSASAVSSSSSGASSSSSSSAATSAGLNQMTATSAATDADIERATAAHTSGLKLHANTLLAASAADSAASALNSSSSSSSSSGLNATSDSAASAGAAVAGASSSAGDAASAAVDESKLKRSAPAGLKPMSLPKKVPKLAP
jgi:hypothetical protein